MKSNTRLKAEAALASESKRKPKRDRSAYNQRRERERKMALNGPMTCKHPKCVEFRLRDPAFAERMQQAGVVAHYMGNGGIGLEPADYWMLDGITPVSRAALEGSCRFAEAWIAAGRPKEFRWTDEQEKLARDAENQLKAPAGKTAPPTGAAGPILETCCYGMDGYPLGAFHRPVKPSFWKRLFGFRYR